MSTQLSNRSAFSPLPTLFALPWLAFACVQVYFPNNQSEAMGIMATVIADRCVAATVTYAPQACDFVRQVSSASCTTRPFLGLTCPAPTPTTRRWIDAQTRAVSVDFSLYNRDTNLVSVCRFTVELPPDGNLLPSYRLFT